MIEQELLITENGPLGCHKGHLFNFAHQPLSPSHSTSGSHVARLFPVLAPFAPYGWVALTSRTLREPPMPQFVANALPPVLVKCFHMFQLTKKTLGNPHFSRSILWAHKCLARRIRKGDWLPKRLLIYQPPPTAFWQRRRGKVNPATLSVLRLNKHFSAFPSVSPCYHGS